MRDDWMEVYRQECRRPTYVIENGKPTGRVRKGKSKRKDLAQSKARIKKAA